MRGGLTSLVLTSTLFGIGQALSACDTQDGSSNDTMDASRAGCASTDAGSDGVDAAPGNAEAGALGAADAGPREAGGRDSEPAASGEDAGSSGSSSDAAMTASDAGDSGAGPVAFETRTLSSDHYAEGAAIDDVNGDGKLDLIAGPNWYAAPAFELGGTIVANPPKLGMDAYSLFFLTFSADLNGDKRVDVIAIGDAGGGNGSGTPNAHWFENPGPDGLARPWPKHPLVEGLVSNESPAFAQLVGDAQGELVFMSGGKLGYATPGSDPRAAWRFTSISGDTSYSGPYVHGLGVGDIDGDGAMDVVERSGYFRQTPGGAWERRAFEFWLGDKAGRAQNWGGAQMAVYDVDGDGDADVVSALAAHQYGLAWFEQRPGQNPPFVGHEILPATASSENVSQLHALISVDINGDGLLDIVTGKRFYAHPSRSPDPGTRDPAKLLWFELKRDANGARFVQHVVHADSGAGCSFAARDVNADGKVDIFTTSKRGTFLHLQK